MDYTSERRRWFSRRIQILAVGAAILLGISAGALGWKWCSTRTLRTRQWSALEGDRVCVLEEVSALPLAEYLPDAVAENLGSLLALTVVLDGSDASVANLRRLREVPQLTRLVLTDVTLSEDHTLFLAELPLFCPQLQPTEIYESLNAAPLASIPPWKARSFRTIQRHK